MSRHLTLIAFFLSLAISSSAAGALFVFTSASGLSAEAEFTLIDTTTLEVRYRNLSTGVPLGFDSSDQLLTGVSWDFGEPGFNGDPEIIGGSVITGLSSASINFDPAGAPPPFDVGASADVSGEYAFGNMDGTGALTNFVTANTSGATPFGGANLDGPDSIDGPQAGLVATPILVPLGGLGAIQDEVIATLLIDTPLANLDFLFDNGVRWEFGSDAFFFTIPEPSSVTLAALAFIGLSAYGWRRRKR